MSYSGLMAEIAAGATIAIDGATGTELQRRGARMYGVAWCALATAEHPDMLRGIHVDYIRAGARIVTANTFATTREVLEGTGHGVRFEELNRKAVELALEAREATPAPHPVLVAGSISHTRPASKTRAWSPQNRDAARFEDDCAEMAAIHKAAGVDLILAEMMGDADFTPAVMRAVKAAGLPLWVGFSALPRDDGTLGTFTDAAKPFAEALAPAVAEGGADVMGIMHTKAERIAPALALLKQHWSGPLMAYPDSMPKGERSQYERKFSDALTERELVAYSREWRQAGVQILGGCCGLTVSHIVAIARDLAA